MLAGLTEAYCQNTESMIDHVDIQIERIAKVAFESAQKRKGKLCSVEKSNVLEVSQLWKEVVTRVGEDYPDVELSHMYAQFPQPSSSSTVKAYMVAAV